MIIMSKNVVLIIILLLPTTISANQISDNASEQILPEIVQGVTCVDAKPVSFYDFILYIKNKIQGKK